MNGVIAGPWHRLVHALGEVVEFCSESERREHVVRTLRQSLGAQWVASGVVGPMESDARILASDCRPCGRKYLRPGSAIEELIGNVLAVLMPGATGVFTFHDADFPTPVTNGHGRVLCSFAADAKRPAHFLMMTRESQRPFSVRERQWVDCFHRAVRWIYGPAPSQPAVALSPQLDRVLKLLLSGAGEKQVATAMGLSRHTVHSYVKAIYRRMEVSGRSELLARFLRPVHQAS